MKLHSRKCFARALICAVENKRDEDGMNDWAFWCAASDGVFFEMAHSYYDGLLECICEVMPQLDRDGIPYCRQCRDWHMGANHVKPLDICKCGEPFKSKVHVEQYVTGLPGHKFVRATS